MKGRGNSSPCQAKPSRAQTAAAWRREPGELPPPGCASRRSRHGASENPRHLGRARGGGAGGRGLSLPGGMRHAAADPAGSVRQDRAKERRGRGRQRRRWRGEVARAVPHGRSRGLSRAEPTPKRLPDRKGGRWVGKGRVRFDPCNSKRRELARRGTGSVWVFSKSVVSDASSSRTARAPGNGAGASAPGLRDWRWHGGEIQPKGNLQNSCSSAAAAGRAFCTHRGLCAAVKHGPRHAGFTRHPCAGQPGRVTWKHAMPKEIPATMLILDSMVDVTRKKQPCGGGKASTWVQCFPPAQSRNWHLPRAPGEDAKGFWLPPSCVITELPLGCSQGERGAGQGDSSEERPLHHPDGPAG